MTDEIEALQTESKDFLIGRVIGSRMNADSFKDERNKLTKALEEILPWTRGHSDKLAILLQLKTIANIARDALNDNE